MPDKEYNYSAFGDVETEEKQYDYSAFDSSDTLKKKELSESSDSAFQEMDGSSLLHIQKPNQPVFEPNPLSAAIDKRLRTDIPHKNLDTTELSIDKPEQFSFTEKPLEQSVKNELLSPPEEERHNMIERLGYRASGGILPLVVVSAKRAMEKSMGQPALIPDLFKLELQTNSLEQQAIKEELSTYNTSDFENILGDALQLIVDVPIFKGGAKLGSLVSKPLLESLGFINRNLVKQGVENITAKQITNNIAKKYLGNVIGGMPPAATALGGYSFLGNVQEQLQQGADWEDIELGDALKSGATSSALAVPLSFVSPAFSFAGKLAQRNIDNNITKKLVGMGVKAAEIPAEAAIFSITDPSQFVKNVELFSLLRIGNKITDWGKIKDTHNVELSPEELKIIRGKFDNINSLEGLETSPKEIESLLKDPDIPLVAKTKIAWRYANVKPEGVDFDPNSVEMEGKPGEFSVKTFNKEGQLINIKSFDSSEEALSARLSANKFIEDQRLLKTTGELDVDQQTKVDSDIGGTSDLVDIATVPVDKRTPEQQDRVKKLRKSVIKVKADELTQQEEAAKRNDEELLRIAKEKTKEDEPAPTIEDIKPRETFMYQGQPAFIGIVDTTNGKIVTTGTYKEQSEGHKAYWGEAQQLGGKFKRFTIDSLGNVQIMEGINKNNLRELNLPRDIKDQIEIIGQKKEGGQENAVQEQSPNEMDVRQQAGNGEGMGGQNIQPEGVAREAPQNEPGNIQGETQKEEIDNVKFSNIKETLKKENENKPPETSAIFGSPLRIFQNTRGKIKPSGSFSQWWGRNMRSSRGAPSGVREAWYSAIGKIKKRHQDIRWSVNDAIKDLYTEHGVKFTEDELKDINTALENMGPTKQTRDIFFNLMQNKIKNIPIAKSRAIVERMRDMVDKYQDEFVKLDLVNKGLQDKIDLSRGYYLTRTYKKHTDRTWTWDNIPEQIKEDAAKVFVDLFPKKTEDEILGMMKSMLESKDLTDFIIRQGDSISSVDKRSLKRRSPFLTDNPEVRALLGENNNPFYNYAVSLTRLSEMIEKGKMIENFANLGLKDGWISTSESYDKNHITKLDFSDDPLKTFGGEQAYYTTPEIAEALKTYLHKPTLDNGFLRAWLKGVTAVKLAKTAGSVKGMIRNFKSNTTNVIANGNWNVKDTVEFLYNNLKDKASYRNFYSRLLENNIVGDSVNAGELMRNVQDLSNKLSYINRGDEFVGEAFKRKYLDKIIKTYGFMDDVWKVWRYGSEFTRYKKAYDLENKEQQLGLTDKQIEDRVNKDVMSLMHKTSTYYSEIPQFLQKMRYLPAVNTFVTWPYLTLINSVGTLETAWKELHTPYLRHIGIQRASGFIMGVSALALMANYQNKKKGISDKVLNAFRRFLPDFWKNDIITVTKDNKDGTVEYNNTSYMDYYGVVTTPVLMLQRQFKANGTLTSDDLIDALQEWGGKFIGWDILYDKVTKLKANQKDESGRHIYNEQADWTEQFGQMSDFLWEGFEPGTITDARRIYRTYKEGGAWQKQIIGTLTGSQSRSIDPLKSLQYFKLPQLKRDMDEARKIYTDQLYKYNRIKEPTPMDKYYLDGSKERANKALNKILEESIKDYDAALTVGVDPGKLDDVINDKKLRLDMDVRDAIYSKMPVMLDEEGGITLKIE